MAKKAELQVKYLELYGKKPDSKLTIADLKKAIGAELAEKNLDSIEVIDDLPGKPEKAKLKRVVVGNVD